MDDARTLEILRAVTAALASHYRVERELGHGGMATVYLAEDLRHHRRVAVKVLHPELGASLGAERFLREIRVTAGLTHPHILPLHDSGEADGFLYYVMPLVEGESLRERITRERQLPVEDSIKIACDIASALDYAHRHGVVHRDIKPENVLLHDGRALVADFGIARAVQRAADTDTLTGTGISLGTPQYMSPEQAAGERELDARTDVFALGCVLYEMLVGTPPFMARTIQGTIAKVMAEAPRPLASERRSVPVHVSAAVMRALEKVPADRFATAAQFADALSPSTAAHTASTSISQEPVVTATGRRVRLTRRDAVWAAIAATLAVIALVAVRRDTTTNGVSQLTPVRFTLAIEDSQRVSGAPGPVTIAPDGRTIVYVGEAGAGRRMMYVRQLDQMTAKPMLGTEGAISPFFSPDGQWVAFHQERSLKKVPVTGGRVVTISDTLGIGATWGPHDVIVGSLGGKLVRISASGGAPVQLAEPDSTRGERALSAPMFLPDGKTVAFRISPLKREDPTRIGLLSIDAASAGYKTLDTRGGAPIGYVEGMLVVAYPEGTVSAIPVDISSGRVLGEAAPMFDQVVWNINPGAALSSSGSLVYLRGGGEFRLTIVDERGAMVERLAAPGRYQHPRFSPDGRRIALDIGTGEARAADIWLWDFASGILSRLTSHAHAARPEWTPDGKRVAYIYWEEGQPLEVWWTSSDKSKTDERLYAMGDGRRNVNEIAISPRGDLAVLRSSTGSPRTFDLWLLQLDTMVAAKDRRLTPLVQTPFSEAMPAVSPDGRWLAYISDETGQYEVYVRPFPGPGGPTQVSTGGGVEPTWAPDGRRLIYRSRDQFVAATLQSKAAAQDVSVTDRRTLFEGRYRTSLPLAIPAQYDVHPDGKRFVVLEPTSKDRDLVVVLNWAAELKSRTAARK